MRRREITTLPTAADMCKYNNLLSMEGAGGERFQHAGRKGSLYVFTVVDRVGGEVKPPPHKQSIGTVARVMLGGDKALPILHME